MSTPKSFKSAKIVGCGLIGTSIALRLHEIGVKVSVFDTNEANLALARDLINSHESLESGRDENPEVIIVATPPNSILAALLAEFESNPNAIFIEVSGVKSNLLVKVEEFPDLLKSFCAVHPMAGREVSGPAGARSDLFESRAWIVSPGENSSQRSISIATELGELLGSTPYQISARDHDSAIAAVSHMPQILSSLLAASLLHEGRGSLDLAGQGLRDMTRLADSDSALWSSLLLENSDQLQERLRNFADDLTTLAAALESSNVDLVKDFLKKGNKGKASIPGKHGAKNRDYTFLPIVINDQPGQLSAIFNECALANVNVEDLQLEHSPGQQTGLITLALSDQDASKLKLHLEERGWMAHELRK
jgi:prephenate dehydrogenase